MVAEEMILFFPTTELVDLCTGYLVEIDEGHALDGGDVGGPLCLWLAHNLACLRVVGIARCE